MGHPSCACFSQAWAFMPCSSSAGRSSWSATRPTSGRTWPSSGTTSCCARGAFQTSILSSDCFRLRLVICILDTFETFVATCGRLQRSVVRILQAGRGWRRAAVCAVVRGRACKCAERPSDSGLGVMLRVGYTLDAMVQETYNYIQSRRPMPAFARPGLVVQRSTSVIAVAQEHHICDYIVHYSALSLMPAILSIIS